MDDVLLIEKLIEISKENGSSTKENQLIKENNKILLEKLNTQSELTGLAEILDELLNVDNEVIEKKTKLLNNDRIKESLNKFRNESTRKTIVKRVLKKEPLSEE